MTRLECVTAAAREFRACGIEEAENDARLLMMGILGIGSTDWILARYEAVTEEEKNLFEDYCERRKHREPVQQILENQCFYGLDFRVTRDVLCPRPETELLVELAIPSCANGRVLDLCTGSGCIAVSLAKYSKASEVVASDLSKEALAIARENALRNGVSVTFYESDLLAEVPGTFRVIVSNPPYIPSGEKEHLQPEVRDYEPAMALFGGEDGLAFYRRIAKEAYEKLESGGELFLEIGFDQGESVPKLLMDAGFTEVTVKKDYAGLDRMVRGRKE